MREALPLFGEPLPYSVGSSNIHVCDTLETPGTYIYTHVSKYMLFRMLLLLGKSCLSRDKVWHSFFPAAAIFKAKRVLVVQSVRVSL